jgi:TRAP-type mannitol/chloroaromatic compound transport system permease large subunit
MVLCFALTVSVAVSIGLAVAVLGIQVANANMLISVKEMFNSINKFPLAAIPFFILAGNLMETGGISRRLVEFAKSAGRRRAGRPAHDLRADLHDLRRGVGLVAWPPPLPSAPS